MTTERDIEAKFWKALKSDMTLMLGLVGETMHSQPMTAQFDEPDTAGNGSLMRLAPVVLAHASDPALAVRRAADSSRTTHAAREAVDACRWLAVLLLRALGPRPIITSIAKSSMAG